MPASKERLLERVIFSPVTWLPVGFIAALKRKQFGFNPFRRFRFGVLVAERFAYRLRESFSTLQTLT